MNTRYYIANFSSFVVVGGLFYVLAVGLNSLAIDVLDLHPFWFPLLIITALFVGKYYAYLLAGTITPSFWRYAGANVAMTFASALGIGFLVDWGMSGWLASGVSLGVFTILRYFVLYYLKVIRRPEQPACSQ